jgi:hypothetical protein
MSETGTWTPHTGRQIDELYAWIVVEDDGEGVAGANFPEVGWVALVGANGKMIEKLRPYAKAIQATGKTVRLVKFSTREVLEELRP